MRERTVEIRLVEELEKIGLACVKFIPDNMNGMPDRVVLLPDERVIWVETKAVDGKLSEIQKYRHVQLRKMGQRVETIWSAEQVFAFVGTLSAGK